MCEVQLYHSTATVVKKWRMEIFTHTGKTRKKMYQYGSYLRTCRKLLYFSLEQSKHNYFCLHNKISISTTNKTQHSLILKVYYFYSVHTNHFFFVSTLECWYEFHRPLQNQCQHARSQARDSWSQQYHPKG